MDSRLVDILRKSFQDRRAILWVCQRYDLLEGQAPHDNGATPEEALLRYRKQITQADEILANLFWESVWIESAYSSLLSIIRKRDVEGGGTSRRIVLLGSGPDAKAQVRTSEFLPIFLLSGLLETHSDLPSAIKFGAVGKRMRDRIAWDLASRISEYPDRLLVIVGASSLDDLTFVKDVLDESPIQNLKIVLVTDGDFGSSFQLRHSHVEIVLLKSGILQFASDLIAQRLPKFSEPSATTIRVGKESLSIQPKDLEMVRRSFFVFTEEYLTPSDDIGLADLEGFFSGSISNWKCYASTGLPIERDYRTTLGEHVEDVVLGKLRRLEKLQEISSFFHYFLPCENGSGATTFIRKIAFRAAKEGFPALVMRPDRVNIETEEVISFANALIESGIKASRSTSQILLLVFDVEHQAIGAVKKIGQQMAAAGRSVVVIQAIRSVADVTRESESKNAQCLPTLTSDATDSEIALCHSTLHDIQNKFKIEIEVPDLNAWTSFLASNRYRNDLQNDPTSEIRFWVALWFFLTRRTNFSTGLSLREAISTWIQRRVEMVQANPLSRVLDFVAILSSFRLVAPMWSVLRPVTGGTFDTSLVKLLSEMEGIVEWGEFQDSQSDQSLRFIHPAMAIEYLRIKGVFEQSVMMGLLKPVLENLTPGHPADMWLAETLSAEVFSPDYRERQSADWEWSLNSFKILPPQVVDQSRTILHHWARCLYLSLGPKNANWPSSFDRVGRLEESISMLRRAIDLPQKSIHDEHPSHLYNTLGTAYYRLARELTGLGETVWSAKITEMWNECSRAFNKSLSLSGYTNVEAMLAFAQRKIEFLKMGTATEALKLEEIAGALHLLNDAEEALTALPAIDLEQDMQIESIRTTALGLLKSESALSHIKNLKGSSKAELGYYCEAQLALGDGRDVANVENAANVLIGAKRIGVSLGQRSLQMLTSLIRRTASLRFDFDLLNQLYSELEVMSGSNLRPIDVFGQAVVLFQVDRYYEGVQKFGKLREMMRRIDGYKLRVRDVWRDHKDPSIPRVAVIRIDKITTEFRAEGIIEEIGQKIVLRPRHWTPMPKINDRVTCVVRFESNGPLAVPPKFEGL